MTFAFFILVLASIVGLCVGLIKPSRVKMKSRKQVSWIFGGGILIFFLLIGITAPSNESPTTSAVSNAPVNNVVAKVQSTSTPISTSQAPLTDKQKVENIVSALLQQSMASEFTGIKSIDVEDGDSTMPKGSKSLTIQIETGTFWDDTRTITETGQLSSQIFQQVFAIDPNFHDILVQYYGSLTDQYGNVSDGMMLGYGMDRSLYGKINWAGFSDTQNDIHLCAFIREQFNTMSQADQGNSVDSCVVILNSLRKAEDAIETSNPQYSDIPQYN